MRRLLLALFLLASPAAAQVTVNGSGSVYVNGVPAWVYGHVGDVLEINNAGSGLDGTIRAVVDSDGTASALSLSTTGARVNGSLVAATGNEIAATIAYTVNKATSGNDTGLLINQTDTASPGTSLLIDAQRSGTSKFSVDNAGITAIGVSPASATLHVGQVGAVASFRVDTSDAVANAFQIENSAGSLGTAFSVWNYGSGVGTPLITRSRSLAVQTREANTDTSGSFAFASVAPTYNQTSGTAANTDLLINRTSTAIGSGAQLLVDAQVGGTSKFSVSATAFVTLAGVAFASLGTPADGTFAYCSDCTIASPCAGSGTGALAKRLNGAWVCN